MPNGSQQINQMSDHDLLVRLDQRYTDLLENVKTYHVDTNSKLKDLDTKLDTQAAICSTRLPECNKLFLSSKVFYWVIGTLVLFVSSVGGLGLANKNDITALTTKQAAIIEHAKKHDTHLENDKIMNKDDLDNYLLNPKD